MPPYQIGLMDMVVLVSLTAAIACSELRLCQRCNNFFPFIIQARRANSSCTGDAGSYAQPLTPSPLNTPALFFVNHKFQVEY